MFTNLVKAVFSTLTVTSRLVSLIVKVVDSLLILYPAGAFVSFNV